MMNFLNSILIQSENLKTKEKIPVGLLLLMCLLLILLMPYGLKFLPICLSITYLFLFIAFIFNPINLKSIKPSYLILPGFFVIGLFSMIYTENTSEGMNIIERQINFLGLPLLFIYLNQKVNLKLNIVFNTLAISLIISITLILAKFLQDIPILIDKATSIVNFFHWFRTNNYLFFNHSTYFSYLLLIQIIYYLSQFYTFNKPGLIIQTTCFVLGLGMLILLNSRSALLTFISLILYFLIKFTLEGFYLKVGFVVVITFSLLFVAIKFTRIGTTFQSSLQSEKKIQTKKSITRHIIWKHALKLIKEKPILGYGIGDAAEKFVTTYEEKHSPVVKIKYNAHNQFLETWLYAGIPGLISSLLIFVFSIIHAVRKRQEIFFLFLCISLLIALFESVFIRLNGIVYFCFFYSFLYFREKTHTLK